MKSKATIVTKAELAKLVENAAESARKSLVERQESSMMPVWYIVSAYPEYVPNMVIGTPWSGDHEKHQAVAAVKQAAQAMEAEAVCFSSEVWMLKLEPGEKALDRPSQSPKRIEGVQIIAFNRRGEYKAKHLLTIRDKPGGRIIELRDDPEQPGHYESWMFDGMFYPTSRGGAA